MIETPFKSDINSYGNTQTVNPEEDEAKDQYLEQDSQYISSIDVEGFMDEVKVLGLSEDEAKEAAQQYAGDKQQEVLEELLSVNTIDKPDVRPDSEQHSESVLAPERIDEIIQHLDSLSEQLYETQQGLEDLAAALEMIAELLNLIIKLIIVIVNTQAEIDKTEDPEEKAALTRKMQTEVQNLTASINKIERS